LRGPAGDGGRARPHLRPHAGPKPLPAGLAVGDRARPRDHRRRCGDARAL